MASRANDQPSFPFTFSPHQTPAQTQPAPSPGSPQRPVAFTFGSPPATGVNFPSSSPRVTFSPPSTSSVTSPSSHSQTESPRPIARPGQSPATPSEYRTPISTPLPSWNSTTSTARELFTALDLGADSPEAAVNVPSSVQESVQRSSSFLNHDISNYRDLYSVTPSPQPASNNPSSQTVSLNAASSSPSDLESVASGLPSLTAQNIETSSAGSEDAAETDSGLSSEGSGDDDPTDNLLEEELPHAPIYDARLQESLGHVRRHLANLAVAIEGTQLVRDQDTHLSALYGQVQTASKFEYPETRIVGFIGDSGVGKSSLINSLLHHEGLARSSGNGEACTSVVSEFRQVDETHPQPFTIEADYMSATERKELLQELIKDYRMHHTRVFREEFQGQLSEQEIERIMRLSERAWRTLKSLFSNEADMTEEFLSNDAPHAEEAILTQFEEWALAGLDHRPGGREALRHRIEARDIDDCREVIDMLTVASREPNRPAIWPFVKLIRVYLRSPVLRTGLVIADLPGFRDLNHARVRATERYLRDVCDEVFVVSAIVRCKTDPSIQEIIEKRVCGQPLRIVCTRSESDLNAQEIAREPAYSAQVRNQARRMFEQIEEATDRLTSISRRRRRSSGAREGRYAIQEAKENDELDRLWVQLMTLLIEARNESTTRHLLRQYQPNVRVFCVSSKLYAKHRGVVGEQAAEYIRLSGITGLRQYCQSIPAEAQLRATSTFLRDRMPALLGSLNQWVLAGSNAVTVERASTLRRVLNEAQRTLESRLISRNSCIRSAQAGLNTQFQNSITRSINTSSGRWKAEAIKTMQGWKPLHHSTYAAFCRKYGFHNPGKTVMRSWNSEILEGLSEELGEGWSTLLAWLYDQQYSTEDRINDLFETIRATIQGHIDLAPEPLDNLLDNLETQRRCILDIIQRMFGNLFAHSERINRNALDGHGTTSYIADIMRPAYNACNAESGGGSDARRKAHMDQHVRYSQLFPQLSRRIQTDYMDMADSAFTELRRKVAEEVRNMTRNLGAAIAVEGEVTEAGREPELAQRVRAAVTELQTCLDEGYLTLDRLREGASEGR
ncbi:hypothetical protein BDW74DRAFT_176430 [Aspergillus multicolor]|uniref:uncharacterized protein n=1 Tax=Aspergillus multicolor TaxID=41759 RepID=UPI003CCE095F